VRLVQRLQQLQARVWCAGACNVCRHAAAGHHVPVDATLCCAYQLTARPSGAVHGLPPRRC
jgi:hypothetical protein